MSKPHPLVTAAAAGDLPEWAVAGEARRAHMSRVARLLERWCRAQGLGKGEVTRWRAAGYLHDVLRDAPPDRLAAILPDRFRSLPRSAYHGPAAAHRLRDEGIDDRELLRAIRWHTVGSRRFGTLGKALVAADSLEPGRRNNRKWRRALRSRMPREMDSVLIEIIANRIGYLLDARRPVHPRTLRFWNSLVDGL